MSGFDDVLTLVDIGSTDWTGGEGPQGGTRTGTSTIYLRDGTSYPVNHSRAEVLARVGAIDVVPGLPAWVSFDREYATVPIVLNVANFSHAA